MSSSDSSQYREALEVVEKALDALADTKEVRCQAHEALCLTEAYQKDRHLEAIGEFTGVTEALDLIKKMINDLKAVA